jgi:hypothetical protein
MTTQKSEHVKQKAINLISFLKTHSIKKDSPKDSTNTRIADEETSIFGGNYHVDPDEYQDFLNNR